MTQIPNDNIGLNISDFLNRDHEFWSHLPDDHMQNMKNIRDSITYTTTRPIYIAGKWNQSTFIFENFNINRNDNEWPLFICKKLKDYQIAGGIVTGSSIEERQPEQINASTEISIQLETLSEEQQRFVDVIKNHVKEMSNSTDKDTKIIMLTGYAGCGKTSVLQGLKLLDNVKLLYITQTKELSNDIQHKFGIDNTTTFFSFMKKIFNMSTIDVKLMSKVLTKIESGFFLNTKNYKFTETNMIIDDLAELFGKDLENINVIFLDDFNVFTPSQIEFFICGIQKVSELLDIKFIIILAGDFNNISPLYLVENDNYDKITNLCQNDIYNFREQQRITDTDYWNVVKKLTERPLTDKWAFLNKLLNKSRSSFPFTFKIKYKYPFQLCEEAYQKLKRLQNQDEYKITEWFKEISGVNNDFFRQVLDFNIYAYRNRENEYNNLALAFDVLKQFENRNKNIEDIIKFIQFSTFNVYQTKLPHPLMVTGQNMVPILPLIRFFPYKTLCYVDDIPSKTIVYLIDWNLEKGFVTIFRPENKVFYKLYNYPFYINSTHAKLHGIPLQLAVSNSFHSSTGLTLSNKLIVSLANIDHKELFTILTRIPAADKLHVLFSSSFNEVVAENLTAAAEKAAATKIASKTHTPAEDVILTIEKVVAVQQATNSETPTTVEVASPTEENGEAYDAKTTETDGDETLAATAVQEYATATFTEDNNVDETIPDSGYYSGKRKVSESDATELTPEKKTKL